MRKSYPIIIVAMTAALVLSACDVIAAFVPSRSAKPCAAEDMPIMADARDKGSHGGQTVYASPSKFKDVAAFYEEEMTATGWTENEGGQVYNMHSSKYYTKDGCTVWVVISDDRGAGKTTVMIQEEKP